LTAAPRTWLIDLKYDRPPLSMNDRRYWAQKAAITRDLRERAAWLFRAARIPPLMGLSIQLVWIVPDRRDRDDDNPYATLKVVADALGPSRPGHPGAGVVPKDTPEYMEKLPTRIEYRKGERGLYVEIKEVL